MNVVLDTLFLRKPRIEYNSPPICDAIFSSSGGPVIILPDILRQRGPTGGRAGGRGRRFFSFDRYPGQICFQIYVAVDPNNPDSPYNLISECIPDGSIALCSEGYYEISAIDGDGHESARSSPIPVSGDGYTIVTLPVFPHTVAYNLYKSTGGPNGPYHLYWYAFSGNSFEVCVPGCYRITVITPDGETPLSDHTCTDFTCDTLSCPEGLGWNPLLCECVPCDLLENPCPPGYIWNQTQCTCILSGGGGGDLTDIMGPDESICKDTPYTSDFTAIGGTAPFTWQLVSGQIPDGLTLDLGSDINSMTIDGTPTTAQDYHFRIRVSDIVGDFMEKDFSLTVKLSCCDAVTDWNNPGPCRLRIKNYFDGLISPTCNSCGFGNAHVGFPIWDGTFTVVQGGLSLASDPSFTEMDNLAFYFGRVQYSSGVWVLEIRMIAGLGAQIITWQGTLADLTGTNPVGVYNIVAGCKCFAPPPDNVCACAGSYSPATLEVESYKP